MLINLQLIRFSIVICSYICCSRTVAQDSIQINDFNLWFKEISDEITKLKDFMPVGDIETEIESSNAFKSESINTNFVTAIRDDVKQKMQTFVTKAETIVTNIQKSAEAEYDKFDADFMNTIDIECQPDKSQFYFRAKAITQNMEGKEVKDCNNASLPFQSNPFFYNIFTNNNHSTTHVPTNVYDLSKKIQSVANWTAGLNDVFVANNRQQRWLDPKWQYFCSNQSFFKVYPGISWHIQLNMVESEPTNVDFFDCRSEDWYLHASMFPKQVVIIVDKSGSMKGRRKIIANHTIYEILQTLTDNDYFNIIFFSEEPKFLDGTTNTTLLQATSRNINNVIKKIDDIFKPKDIAKYDVGLNAAFDLLENWNRQNGSSQNSCNQAIFVISDGAPEDFSNIFDNKNAQKNIRVFTYLIGQAVTDKENLEKMACSNYGYFVQIATLADVKENVQAYLNVMARTVVRSQKDFTIWSGVHADQMRPTSTMKNKVATNINTATSQNNPTNSPLATVNQVKLGSADSINKSLQALEATTPTKIPYISLPKFKKYRMFTSCARAIIDKNSLKKNNEAILLGVAGTDVPLENFQQLAPSWKYGIGTYLFGVTNNAYVLFHPNFRPVYKNNLKAYYKNVDILEVELPKDPNSTEFTNLRKMLVERSEGNTATPIEVYAILDNFKTAFLNKYKYYTFPIDKTPFSFGLALMEDKPILRLADPNAAVTLSTTEFGFTAPEICNNKFKEESLGCMLSSKYYFCNFDEINGRKFNANPMCAFLSMASDKDLRDKSSCNNEFFNLVLKEASSTKTLKDKWSKAPAAKNIKVIQQFLLYHSGQIRYRNFNITDTYPDFLKDHLNGADDKLYVETAMTREKYGNDMQMIFKTLPNDVMKNYTKYQHEIPMTVTSPVMASKAGNPVMFGAMGIQISFNSLSDVFSSATKKCSDTTKPCLTCNNTQHVHCYLINYASLIVATNKENSMVGESVFSYECKLMEQFITDKIFTKQVLQDNQALCPQDKKSSNFANKIMSPLYHLWKFIVWLVYESIIFFSEFSFSSLWWEYVESQDSDSQPFWLAAPSTRPPRQQQKKPASSSSRGTNKTAAATATAANPSVSAAQQYQDPKSQNDAKDRIRRVLSNCVTKQSQSADEYDACVRKMINTECQQLSIEQQQQQQDDSGGAARSTAGGATRAANKHVRRINLCRIACQELKREDLNTWKKQQECRSTLEPCKLQHKTFVFEADATRDDTVASGKFCVKDGCSKAKA